MNDLERKIKTAIEYSGLSQAKVASTIINKGKPMSVTNFNNKLKRGSFSQDELQALALALGAKYLLGFEFPDGTKI